MDFYSEKSQRHASSTVNTDLALKNPARSSRQNVCNA